MHRIVSAPRPWLVRGPCLLLWLWLWLCAAPPCAAQDRARDHDRARAHVVASERYHYELTLPPGWVRVPTKELEDYRKDLPPQAAGMIYDMAIQPGNREWFDHPYVMVQVIPPRSGPPRLPTEAEFSAFVEAMSGEKVLAKYRAVADSVQDPGTRKTLLAAMSSLAHAPVTTDVARRKYSQVTETVDNLSQPIKIRSTGFFVQDGSAVQLIASSHAAEYPKDARTITAIEDSFHSSALPPPAATPATPATPAVPAPSPARPRPLAQDPLDPVALLSSALLGAMLGLFGWVRSRWKKRR